MQHVAPLLIGSRRAANGQAAAGSCVVVFEAPNLPALATSIADWASAHPESTVLSFSHARETRLDDRASLAGPAHVPVYTGLLLVNTASHEADTSLEEPVARALVVSGR